MDWKWIAIGFVFALGLLSVCWAMWLTAKISYRIYIASRFGGYREADDGKG